MQLVLLAESRASRAFKGVYLEWNIPLFSHCKNSDTFLEDARQRMGLTLLRTVPCWRLRRKPKTQSHKNTHY